jgi:hypothetical protein
MVRLLVFRLVPHQCLAALLLSLSGNRLYTSIASGCSTVNVSTSDHPTKKVFTERGVHIVQVRLCNRRKYPIFHIRFPFDPQGQTPALFFAAVRRNEKKANGNWPYSFVGLSDNTIVSVENCADGTLSLKYETYRESASGTHSE